ncbi:1-phosphatidylinositol-4-phosphate 5-kinase [Pseudohyphozyma bogoriensis]|nr:1-phosphatidylinositol-4-phosphate 5-kinase [Pseudohyphozyma bogoriensis]
MLAQPPQPPAPKFYDRPAPLAEPAAREKRLSSRASTNDDEINPLFTLSEEVSSGQSPPVHVLSVGPAENGVVLGQGSPTSKLYRPLHLLHHGRLPSSESRVSSRKEGSMNGNGSPRPDEGVANFQDHEEESSKRDELRFAFHQKKMELKDQKRRKSSTSTMSTSTRPEADDEIKRKLASPVFRDEDDAARLGHLQRTGSLAGNGRDCSSSSYASAHSQAPSDMSSALGLDIPRTSTPPPLEGVLAPEFHLIAPTPDGSTFPSPAETPISLPTDSPQSFLPSPPTTPTSAAPPTIPDEVEMDDVEASIAHQESLIRKQRMEKAKERETAAGGEGGAPVKRRSTRIGSGGSGMQDEGPLVGNLIGTDHSNYVLMYNMLTGIRIGVSRCQAKVRRPLTDEDYTARHKFSFDIVGNELTPSTKYDFKFKDYAPWVFRELREYFYLDPSDYLVSLTAKYILSELGSPGKSGSFFYFSRDYRFIIKTIRHSEHKFLRSILKEYHEYIKENPHTLLSRFYGLHRVKLPRGRKIHFVIMNNLLPPHRDIHEKYDLKGSSVGRLTPEEKAQNNPNAILKDLNWIQRGRELALGPEKKALFEEQVRRDTALMQRLGIMDYSLFAAVHNVDRGNTENLRDGHLSVFQPDPVKLRRRKATQVMRDEDVSALRKAIQRSDPKALSESNKLPEVDTSERRLFLFYQDDGGVRATGDNNETLDAIYYLGIIDILTPYTFVKKVEHFFRGLKFDSHQISAVPPKEYGDRFLAFIYSIIHGNDVSQRPKMWSPPEPAGNGKAKEKEKEKAQ